MPNASIETAPLELREFDDRAVRWLLEVPENLRGVFQILAQELGDRMDFSRMRLLPAARIPAALRERRADLLVGVPFRSPGIEETREVIIFVLSEHLSEPDDLVLFWLLYEMALIWEAQVRRWRKNKAPRSERKLTPIVPVLLYTAERHWEIPLSLDQLMTLPSLLAPYVPRFEFLRLNMTAGPGESSIGEIVAQHPIGAVLEALQKGSMASEAELETMLLAAIARVEEMDKRDRDAWERALIILYLLVYHRRTQEEGSRLSEKLDRVLEGKKDASRMVQTLANALIEKGERIGIEKGTQVARKMARVVIEQKFGPLNRAAARRLNYMDLDRLNALVRGVQDANSLEELGI